MSKTKPPAKTATLNEWLAYLEQIHPQSIEMGLGRVMQVAQLAGLKQAHCPVITVAGTNGKGSICAMLTAIYTAAGYRVGTYTSPHLVHFNERIALDGHPVQDAVIVDALAYLEETREAVSLTYFEYTTLAALRIFQQAAVEIMILEVGLGGRLDAVNIVDADCAIVSSIDFDHQSYLGDTLEKIAFEKAGVFRPNKIAICGQPYPPLTLISHAQSIGARLQVIGQDFGYWQEQESPQQWHWWADETKRHSLAIPALRGQFQLQNASCVLLAIQSLREILPVESGALRTGLLEVVLAGRFQVLAGRPVTVLDVAHNPHAAAGLATNLGNMGFFPCTHAVFGMLADKDAKTVVQQLAPHVQHWHLADLSGERGRSAEQLAQVLQECGINEYTTYSSPSEAWQGAMGVAKEADRILVCGSFYMVAAVSARLI